MLCFGDVQRARRARALRRHGLGATDRDGGAMHVFEGHAKDRLHSELGQQSCRQGERAQSGHRDTLQIVHSPEPRVRQAEVALSVARARPDREGQLKPELLRPRTPAPLGKRYRLARLQPDGVAHPGQAAERLLREHSRPQGDAPADLPHAAQAL
eukprot:8782239-Pyramimonas_sp.AAC.1